MKSVIVVCYNINDLSSGGKIRIYEMLKYLRGDKILIQPGNNSSEFDSYSLKKFRKNSSKYEIVSFLLPLNQIRTIAKIIKECPDRVFAEHLWSMFPVFWVKVFLGKKTKVIFDTHNFEYEYFVQKRSVIKYLVFLAEMFMCKIADEILVCSNREKILFENSYKINPKKIKIVKNGALIYSPNSSREDVLMSLGINDKKFIVLFMGKLDYMPNKVAVDRIREIASKLDNTKYHFVVVGIGGEKFKDLNNVTFTGKVDNVFNYINVCDLCIAPIEYGSGTRLKILEYMGSGKLVLTTKKGCEGIKVVNNKNIIIDDIKNFTKRIEKISSDPSSYLSVAMSGRRLVKKEYMWEDIISSFEK